MPIVIRPLSNKDAIEAIELILPIQQLEFGVPITLADQPDLTDIDRYYHDGGGNFLGAFQDGTQCGTIAMLRFGQNEGALRKMFVKKEFRGGQQGIAKLLLDELSNHANQIGIEHLYLGTIHTLQAAIRFYNKNGFVQKGRNGLPIDFPIMRQDNVFFYKNIKRIAENC